MRNRIFGETPKIKREKKKQIGDDVTHTKETKKNNNKTRAQGGELRVNLYRSKPGDVCILLTNFFLLKIKNFACECMCL